MGVHVSQYQADLTDHYKAVRARLERGVTGQGKLLLVPPEPAPLVRDIIDVSSPEHRRRITAIEVLKVVARVTGVPVPVLRGPMRFSKFVKPRHMACYLIKMFCTHLSYPQIAKSMHRDHSTVIYAARKSDVWKEQDSEYAAQLAEAQAILTRMQADDGE